MPGRRDKKSHHMRPDATQSLRMVKVPMVVATVDGVRHEIPEIWLVGATREDRAAGMHPSEAYARAIARWIEQGKLQDAHDAAKRHFHKP